MGSRVLDLACGTGDLCRELERASLRPIGVDFSFGMLVAGSYTMCRSCRATRCACPCPTASIDGVTCGFALRNFVDLGAFFTELARVVRPHGHVALLEVAEPRSRLLRFGHGVYFGKVVPRIGGLFSDGSAYRYLPKSVAYLPPPDTMLDMLRRRGVRVGGAAHAVGRHRPTDRRHAIRSGQHRDRAARGHPSARRRRRPGRRWPATTVCCGPAAKVGSRDGARPCASTCPGSIPATAAKAVHDALDRIEIDDEVGLPGCGPVAIGALPFDPDEPGTLVVPELLVGTGRRRHAVDHRGRPDIRPRRRCRISHDARRR